MKRQLSIFLLLLLLFSSISAQEKESKLIDGLTSLWQSEALRTVDNLLFKLQDNPEAIGFVISYEGKYAIYEGKKLKKKLLLPKYGETSCRIQAIRNHIKERRKFPIDRILFVDGGFREEQEIEFWIVPENAEFPKLTPTLDKIQYGVGKPFCNYWNFY